MHARMPAPVDAVEVAEDLTVLLDRLELRRARDIGGGGGARAGGSHRSHGTHRVLTGVPTHTGY